MISAGWGRGLVTVPSTSVPLLDGFWARWARDRLGPPRYKGWGLFTVLF